MNGVRDNNFDEASRVVIKRRQINQLEIENADTRHLEALIKTLNGHTYSLDKCRKGNDSWIANLDRAPWPVKTLDDEVNLLARIMNSVLDVVKDTVLVSEFDNKEQTDYQYIQSNFLPSSWTTFWRQSTKTRQFTQTNKTTLLLGLKNATLILGQAKMLKSESVRWCGTRS